MGRSNSLANPAILDKIDKLFASNTGNYIDLPQIIVIGDQSSGKSSVLESLTDLPFPKDSGLCTRFATQITFRRHAVPRISVEIVPGKGCDSKHAEKVRSWKKDIKKLDQATFESIMHEVHEWMGLSKEPGTKLKDGQKIFTDDVLSIHVAGPQEEHFSIIDVPGVFKNPQPPVTERDMKMVEKMVLGYMSNSRSVMLAVIPANVDIATQSILQSAKSVDPEGQRTLGVLTKPDLVDKGAESSVIDLVEGRKHHLSLGWSIVKNPGQAQARDPSTNRKKLEEEFFASNAPWNSLPKYKVGVDALRTCLQEILEAHIRREFPKVKLEINKELQGSKAGIAALGKKRDTPEELLAYMVDMAMQFQSGTDGGVNAKYKSDPMFVKYPNLKLATIVSARDEAFYENFRDYGHKYSFSLEPTDGDDHDDASESSDTCIASLFDSPPTKPISSTNLTGEKKPRLCNTRHHKTPDEIDDLLAEEEELEEPKLTGMFEWMKGIYLSSRGFELGTFNPDLISAFMQAQSEKWHALVFGYISDIIAVTHEFVKTLLTVVCPDAKMREKILAMLMDKLVERYKKALSQAEFILKVESDSMPKTGNPDFNRNYEKRNSKRMQMRLAEKSFYMEKQSGGGGGGSPGDKVIRVDDLGKGSTISNVDHKVQSMHDITASYYEVVFKRVADSVIMQAASYHLIDGPDTPLKLFSPALVASLSPEELEDIAGEDPMTKRRREELEKKCKDLEKAKRILF